MVESRRSDWKCGLKSCFFVHIYTVCRSGVKKHISGLWGGWSKKDRNWTQKGLKTWSMTPCVLLWAYNVLGCIYTHTCMLYVCVYKKKWKKEKNWSPARCVIISSCLHRPHNNHPQRSSSSSVGPPTKNALDKKINGLSLWWAGLLFWWCYYFLLESACSALFNMWQRTRWPQQTSKQTSVVYVHERWPTNTTIVLQVGRACDVKVAGSLNKV